MGHWNPWSPDSFFLLLILSRVGLFHIQFAAAAERAEAEASCHFGIPFLGWLLHEAVGAQLNVSSFGKARQALILTCLVPAGGGSPAVPAVSSLSFARIQCSRLTTADDCRSQKIKRYFSSDGLQPVGQRDQLFKVIDRSVVQHPLSKVPSGSGSASSQQGALSAMPWAFLDNNHFYLIDLLK